MLWRFDEVAYVWSDMAIVRNGDEVYFFVDGEKLPGLDSAAGPDPVN